MNRAGLLFSFALIVSLTGCSRYVTPAPSEVCGSCPKKAWDSVNAHLFSSAVVSPIARNLNFWRTGRRLVQHPTPSINLDDGQITDSMFLTDRSPADLSPEQLRWGPTNPNDLPLPPFTISKIKDEGKTGGFFVRDATGQRYLFKLDPYDAPGLMSGAEVTTSKLLYALGYRVPSYEVLYVYPDELILGEEERDDADDLQELIDTHLRADGRLRVAASRFIEGEILGSPRFSQFKDCVEVRSLKLAYAWVNNIDTKDHNALLVKKDEREVVYLIDFGSAFGADASTESTKDPCSGWQYTVDFKGLMMRAVSLGMLEPKCDRQEPFSSAIGRFSATFDPLKWKPYVYNRSFKEMTDEDARWMARRLAEFTPQQIEAAVSAGQYESPEEEAYLVRTLLERRDKILQTYGVNP